MSKVGDARVWLQAHGHQVGARGRIRPELLQEYENYLRARSGDPDAAQAPPSHQPVDPKLMQHMLATGKSHGRTRCGFCTDGVCNMCPGIVARAAAGKDWTCLCYERGHTMEPIRHVAAAPTTRPFSEDD